MGVLKNEGQCQVNHRERTVQERKWIEEGYLISLILGFCSFKQFRLIKQAQQKVTIWEAKSHMAPKQVSYSLKAGIKCLFF